MSNIIKGGCFCGLVRYSFNFGEYPSANCYCSICRRTSGAPFVSWLAIPVNLFKYLNSKPKKIKSSSHGNRFFCEECGTPIACTLEEDPKNINITIASLDNPEEFVPKDDIYLEDMLDWLKK
tara:strand:+ start:164 stop:529 length:366 start_codon:yes stop_codon:yes gene_type:complete